MTANKQIYLQIASFSSIHVLVSAKGDRVTNASYFHAFVFLHCYKRECTLVLYSKLILSWTEPNDHRRNVPGLNLSNFQLFIVWSILWDCWKLKSLGRPEYHMTIMLIEEWRQGGRDRRSCSRCVLRRHTHTSKHPNRYWEIPLSSRPLILRKWENPRVGRLEITGSIKLSPVSPRCVVPHIQSEYSAPTGYSAPTHHYGLTWTDTWRPPDHGETPDSIKTNSLQRVEDSLKMTDAEEYTIASHRSSQVETGSRNSSNKGERNLQYSAYI